MVPLGESCRTNKSRQRQSGAPRLTEPAALGAPTQPPRAPQSQSSLRPHIPATTPLWPHAPIASQGSDQSQGGSYGRATVFQVGSGYGPN
ncbi:hypothetical protein XELAEV_18023302mg [Xenopus laevis]|uniref:Uncharacterized protein n=1 Tax=Xenopus laevis TaxID=8355 RepID=A0A974D6K4_XENLA|nr:hypothetical protein XELAEV_18023302mg [Xenopus laevis]